MMVRTRVWRRLSKGLGWEDEVVRLNDCIGWRQMKKGFGFFHTCDSEACRCYIPFQSRMVAGAGIAYINQPLRRNNPHVEIQ